MKAATVQNVIVRYIWCKRKEFRGSKNSFELKGGFLGEKRDKGFVLLVYSPSVVTDSPDSSRKSAELAWLIFLGGPRKGFPSWHPVTADLSWGLNLHAVPGQREGAGSSLWNIVTGCPTSQSHTYCFKHAILIFDAGVQTRDSQVGSDFKVNFCSHFSLDSILF